MTQIPATSRAVVLTNEIVRLIPASDIRPPHAVQDEKFYRHLHRKMGFFGWVGRPLVVSEHAGTRFTFAAWMGSHRLAAATERGMAVPCVVTPWSKTKCVDRAKAIGVYFDGFPIGDRYGLTVRALRRFEIEEPAWWLSLAIVREERRLIRVGRWAEFDRAAASLRDGEEVRRGG